MQTEIRQESNLEGEDAREGGRREREKGERTKESESTVARAVAGRLTAPKELVSCIWRRAPQIIWGGCQVSTLSSTREESSFLSPLCLSSSLSFARRKRYRNKRTLLFLSSFSPFCSFFPFFSSMFVSLFLAALRERERGEEGREQKDQRTPAPPTPLMICDPLRQPGNLRTQHSSPSKQTVAKEVEKKREVSLSFLPR